MKITDNAIFFENKRDKEILLTLLREVNVGELRPEIHGECVNILERLISFTLEL
jgi:hypothetical protein